MWVPPYTRKKRAGEIGAPMTPGADGEVEAGGVARGAISLRAAAQRRGPGVCPRLPLLLPGHPAASRGAELPGLLPRGEALGVSLAPCLAGVGALSQGHGQGCHPVFSACWVCVLVPCLVRANMCVRPHVSGCGGCGVGEAFSGALGAQDSGRGVWSGRAEKCRGECADMLCQGLASVSPSALRTAWGVELIMSLGQMPKQRPGRSFPGSFTYSPRWTPAHRGHLGYGILSPF